MKRLKRSFEKVITLENFLIKTLSFNVEEFMASLDVFQRQEFRAHLKLLVAYSGEYHEREIESGGSLPYWEWIDRVFETRRSAALARPSHNTNTLSSTIFKSPLWAALDKKLGRSIIQFLVFEACVFLPQQNRTDSYIQLSGDPVRYDAPIRSTCSKWKSSGSIYVAKLRPLNPVEKETIAKNKAVGLNITLPSQVQIPREIITNIKFVVPLAFNQAFPPSKVKWIENFKDPQLAEQYGEPQFKDLSPNLMTLDAMLADTYKRLDSESLHRNFRAIATKKTDIVPQHIVSKFCCSSLRYILPSETLGSRDNWKLLERKIYQYIKLNGHSKYYIENMTKGFKLTETWLGKSSSKQQAELNQKYFRQFMFWVFVLVNEYLLRYFVIRQCGAGTREVYLKKNGWKQARQQKQAEFAQTLTPIDDPQEWQKLTAVTSHIVPKTRPGAYRVLVNLNQFKQVLASSNGVLKYHADQEHETPRIKSVNEAYPLIHQFIQEHAGNSFYAVRTDIQGCFDEANSAKVLEIVEKLVNPTYYTPYYVKRALTPLYTPWNKTIERVTKLGCTSNMRAQVGLNMDQLESSQQWGLNLSEQLIQSPAHLASITPENSKNQVFVEKSHNTRVIPGPSVLGKVERVLRNLVVQVGQGYYLMDKGIPQGSSISTSLCDLLCQDFIRSELSRFWANSNTLILRYVDDFLYITTNRLEAEVFLKTITRSRGFPEYGIFFSSVKTECNFGSASVDQTTFLGIPISWSGNKIHMEPSLELETLIDAARSTARRKHIAIEESMKPGRELKPVYLTQMPADLVPFLNTANWALEDPAWVEVEKIITLKTCKMASVFKTFIKLRQPPSPGFVQRVVRHSVRSICRLFAALELDFKTSRKIIYRFLRLLIKTCGLRMGGIMKHGVDTWLNIYKKKKRAQLELSNLII